MWAKAFAEKWNEHHHAMMSIYEDGIVVYACVSLATQVTLERLLKEQKLYIESARSDDGFVAVLICNHPFERVHTLINGLMGGGLWTEDCRQRIHSKIGSCFDSSLATS